MGFFFTLLYITTAYVTPPVLFGPLAEYHIEVVLALLAVLCSISSIGSTNVFRTPQSWAVVGITLAAAVSIAQTGWLGGALQALYAMMQLVTTFYLIAVNCRTKRHLQWIVLVFFLGSIFFLVNGVLDLRNQVMPSLYLYEDGDLRRLRGLGFVADPNDLAQVLVSLIPAVFLWRQKSTLVNLFLLGPVIAILLGAMYMTHSRGGVLALVGVIALALRKKIGTIASAVIAASLFIGSTLLNWSGGRNISMEAGADRLDLWYGGMQLIKAHPLFGVGLGRFPDYFGITAHNSVVIAAAETGLIGLFFWVVFIFSTTRIALDLSNSGQAEMVTDHESFAYSAWPHPVEQKQPPPEPEQPTQYDPTLPWQEQPTVYSHEQIRSFSTVLAYSIAGMLIAGWFLSRAHSQWLFMYCGMIYSVSRMSTDSGFPVREDKPAFLLPWSLVVEVLLLFFLYMTLRLRDLG